MYFNFFCSKTFEHKLDGMFWVTFVSDAVQCQKGHLLVVVPCVKDRHVHD